MANFNIDRLKFRWKGTWLAGVDFRKDDIVYYEGKAYVCLLGHTSNANFYYDRDADTISQTFNFTVQTDTIRSKSSGNFYVNQKENPELSLLKGRSYTFDQSDSSNVDFNNQANPVFLSNIKNGTLAGAGEYTQGVKYFLDSQEVTRQEYIDGFQLATSRQLVFTLGDNAPDTLYYFSPNNLNMGGKINSKYESYWELMFDGYIWKGDWQTSTFYPEGAIVKYKGYLYQSVNSHTSVASADTGLPGNIENWIVYAATYNWLNEWTVETYYDLGDVVRYNGRTYICTVKHQSAESFTIGLELDESKWSVVSRSDNWRTDWTVSTRYVKDDIVRYGAIVYRCLEGHTSVAALFLGLEFDSDKWEIVVEGIDYKQDWQSDFRYKKGDIVKYGASLWKANAGHTSTTDTGGLRVDEIYWDIWVPGLEYESLWSSTVEYQKGDIVLYGGYSYTALENNINQIPSVNLKAQDTGFWELLTTGYIHRGDWNINTNYRTGNIVRAQGYLYIAVADNFGTYPDSDTNIWQILVDGQKFTAEWIDDQEYFLGDIVTWRGTAYICVNRHVSSSSGSRPDLDQEYDQEDFWRILIQGSPNNILSDIGDIKTYGTETEKLSIANSGKVLKVSDAGNVAWNDYEYVPNVYYVSVEGVDSSLNGTTPSQPFRTVKFACEYIQQDVEARSPATIFIKTGLYQEELPISVPQDTALVGDELRSTTIQPAPGYELSNMFYVRNGSGIRNMTLQGLTGELGPLNQYLTRRPSAGAYVSLDPGTGPDDETVWIYNKSCYVQNVSTFGTGCVGMKVDGSLHNGGNKSIVANDFTQVLSDGIGYWADNVGRSELVSVFTYYCHIGYLCTNGGILRATNGNNSYGEFGTVAEGFDLAETPITATIDNRRNNAQFSEAFTYGTTEQEILAIGYSNTGQTYTSAAITFGGTGTNANAEYNDEEIRIGAVSNVRVLGPDDSSIPGGLNYTLNINNAQTGNGGAITIAQADITESESVYLGQRIVIISGRGVGQYGEITSFDPVSKNIIVSRESDGALGWDHFQPGWPIEDVLDDTTRYSIEPRVEFDEPRFIPNTFTAPDTEDWKFVKFGAGNWVVATSDGKTAYTNDLSSFNPTTTVANGVVGDLIWTGSNFILMYEAGESDADTTAIYTSTNGSSFTASVLPFSAKWLDIASDNQTTVIVTSNSGGSYAVSDNNGSTWTSGTITGTTTQIWNAVGYINGVWVALDTTNGDVAYNADLSGNWTILSGVITAANWSETVFGNNRIVAIAPRVDENDTVKTAYSFDGISWYSSQIDLGNFEYISYAQGVFLATGSDSIVAKSQDGNVWRTFDDSSTSYNLTQSADYGQSQYYDGEWLIVAGTGSPWNTLLTGAKPIIRAKVESSRISQFVIYDPGSNYTDLVSLSVFDNSATVDASFDLFVNDGVLAQPTYLNRGQGYVTVTAEITGDGFAEIFQIGTSINVANLTNVPGPGANLEIAGIEDRRYSITRVNSFSGIDGEIEANFEITPSIQTNESPVHGTEMTIRERYSQARLTGHDFLDIGTGNFNSTRYPQLYLEGEDAENARQPFNETVANGGGRVFYTSTDQDGNFRVGELFEVEQNTGTVTIDAAQFDLAGLTELSLGGIQVGGSAVVITEFSKDPKLSANSNNIVPTQKAIKSFIQGRITGGGSNASTNTLVAGQIQITADEISTTSGLQINVKRPTEIRGGIDGHYFALQYFTSLNN